MQKPVTLDRRRVNKNGGTMLEHVTASLYLSIYLYLKLMQKYVAEEPSSQPLETTINQTLSLVISALNITQVPFQVRILCHVQQLLAIIYNFLILYPNKAHVSAFWTAQYLSHFDNTEHRLHRVVKHGRRN